MIRSLRLAYLHRRSERARSRWIAAGSPDSGVERAAMMDAFMNEGRYRYARLLNRLDEIEAQESSR